MTLSEYYDQLQAHDWFFDYSDDSGVYRSGLASRESLVSIARKSGPEFQKLYSEYHLYMFSGPVFGTEQTPKPARPEVPNER